MVINELLAFVLYARELMTMLEYSKWGNFVKVIDKAKESCKNSNINILDHFADVGKMVKAGVADKRIDDIKLTRYACYLIAQNGDSRKKHFYCKKISSYCLKIQKK